MALAATLRNDRSSTVSRRIRFSSAAEAHSTSTSTTPADSSPWTRLRRLTFDLPNANWIASISAITAGSSPTIQSTAAIQAIQENSRSTSRARPDSGKTTVNTRARKRMPASETSTATATFNTTTRW